MVPPITPGQSAQVDRVLAAQEDYLKRLGARLKEMGVNHPHCLPEWVRRAEWHISGLRSHFAQWASGKSDSPMPKM